MAPTKFLHFLMSFLIIGFTAGLCYKAAVSTQQALNEANTNLWDKTAKNKLTKPAFMALREKLEGYKLIAKTLADMYLNENIEGWNANVGDSPGYLNAALGLQKAWRTELKYVYVSYKITSAATDRWGDIGCEISDDGNSTGCYYTNGQGHYLSFPGTDFSVTPTFQDSNATGVQGESYIVFTKNIKKNSPQANGDWQVPYIYTTEYGTNVAIATYTYPFKFDPITGNCTAAAQVDFLLTVPEAILDETKPETTEDNAHVVLYNSKGSEGVFVSSTNDSVTMNSDEVYPAIGTPAKMPYTWVSDFITTLTNGLKNTYNVLNVTGSFTGADGTYYEAMTYDQQWTIALEVPTSDYYYTRNKWSPKLGLNGAKAELKTIWSDTNTIGIFGIAASIFIFALVNIIIGCCCSGGSARRAGHDDYYVASTQA